MSACTPMNVIAIGVMCISTVLAILFVIYAVKVMRENARRYAERQAEFNTEYRETKARIKASRERMDRRLGS